MPNWKKVVTSGSNAALSQITGSTLTVVSSSLDHVLVNDTLQGNGPGFQFFAYNEDTVKVKFANWYSSNDRQYGMGQLWFETWFAAIDNNANPALRDERRIGFYLEEPDAGSTDSGTPGQHPSNARFYVDVNGGYLSGSFNVTNAITASIISASAFIGSLNFSNLTNTPTLLSSSTQIASNISGSITSTSSSIASDIASLVSFSSSLESTIYDYTGSFTGDGSALTGITSQVTEQATIVDSFTSQTSVVTTHNFGTKNVIVSVFDSNDAMIIPDSIVTTDTNTVTTTLDTSTSGRVVVAKGGHIVSGSIQQSTYRENISGASSYAVTHSLSEDYPIVQVYSSSRAQVIPSEIITTSANALDISFTSIFNGTVVVKK